MFSSFFSLSPLLIVVSLFPSLLYSLSRKDIEDGLEKECGGRDGRIGRGKVRGEAGLKKGASREVTEKLTEFLRVGM